jgi:hypothetical protein
MSINDRSGCPDTGILLDEGERDEKFYELSRHRGDSVSSLLYDTAWHIHTNLYRTPQAGELWPIELLKKE